MLDIETIGIALDTSGLEKGNRSLKETEKAANRAADSADKLSGRFAATDSAISAFSDTATLATRALSGLTATMAVAKVISVQREFDVLNSSLKTVTGSSAAAEREMAWLKDFAKQTPFGLAQATQGFVKMKALGLDPTRSALTSFGNTASAMGKDLNQMIEAVADASTSEFERLREFGIKAKQQGDRVSLTFQGVTTNIGNNAAEITKYLEAIGNNEFAGAMAERTKTLDGAISELGDTWDELFRTVSSQGVGSLIYDTVTLANGAIEDAITILKAMGGAANEAGEGTGALATIQNGLATVFETVAVLGVNLKYTLVGIGKEVGGLAAQAAQAAQLNFSGVSAIRQSMVAEAEADRREVDATTARILGARQAAAEYNRYATRNASAATDPRRVDLGGEKPAPRTPGKTELAEYDKLMQRLTGNLAKYTAEAEQAQHGYNKAQTEFLELAASPAWAKLTDNERANVAATYEKIIATEQAADATKTLEKANAEAALTREKYLASLTTGTEKLQSEIQAQIDATARMGLSKEAVAELDMAKLDMLATDLELQAIKALDRNLDTQTYESLKTQAKLYRDLGKAKKDGATKEMALDLEKANTDAAKKAQDEWERAAESIEQSLTDSLLRGFESGKDFAKNLRDTVVNMFKTLVLRPVISAVMSPIAGAINGAMGGAAGSAGGGMLTSAGGSMLGSMMGGASSLGIGASYGVQSLFANGLGATLSAGGQMIGAGSVMSGIGTIAGALGPIALGIGAVMMLVKKLDDSGTMHTGALSQYSASSGLANSTTHGAFGMGFGGVDYSAETEKFTGAMATSIVQMLDSTATTFGKEAGYKAATAFADDTSKDGAWGGLLISKLEDTIVNWDPTRTSKWAPREFADGAAGKEQYLAAVAADVRVALNSIGLPTWATGMLDKLGQGATIEQLAGAVDQINAAKAAFAGFAQYMPTFAGLADSALGKLMDASGGVGALAGNMSVFVDGFYRDAEKLAVNTQAVTTALAALGFEMPTTRDEFKALVQSQIALGDGGAKTAAGLLALSGAVSSVLPPFEAAAAGVETAIGTVSDAMKRLQSDSASLQIDLLRAQGNATGADAAQRTLDTTGLTAAQVAVYDYNASLRAQITTLEAMERLQSDSTSLQIDLLRAQGRTAQADAAQRALDTQGYTAAQIAAYDYREALRKQVAALEDAGEALEGFIGRTARSVVDADRIRGLAAVGNTAALGRLGVPGYAAGGDHSGGMRLVGENGPELEVTGPSRIYSAPVTAAMLSRSGDRSNAARLEALVEKLLQENALLRMGVEAVAIHTASSAKTLKRLSPNNDALQIRAVPA